MKSSTTIRNRSMKAKSKYGKKAEMHDDAAQDRLLIKQVTSGPAFNMKNGGKCYADGGAVGKRLDKMPRMKGGAGGGLGRLEKAASVKKDK